MTRFDATVLSRAVELGEGWWWWWGKCDEMSPRDCRSKDGETSWGDDSWVLGVGGT